LEPKGLAAGRLGAVFPSGTSVLRAGQEAPVRPAPSSPGLRADAAHAVDGLGLASCPAYVALGAGLPQRPLEIRRAGARRASASREFENGDEMPTIAAETINTSGDTTSVVHRPRPSVGHPCRLARACAITASGAQSPSRASNPPRDKTMAMPIAIAHRGDPVNRRENTLPSFRAAVDAGADMIELDLRRTRDGVIVVLHDPSLSRLWGVDQQIANLVFSELPGGSEEALRIPTLRDAIESVNVPLMVDFTGEEVVEGALNVVREVGAMARSLFVTGNIPALRMLRELAPEARIGVTWVGADPPGGSLLESVGAEYWNPTYRLVTADRVAAMHARGLKVSTWTVDTLDDMARVIDCGVDAIVTNRIADLCGLLSK
jgi:glycerophosphoryl diester phosphodiesterase